jgi:hypothetical protein
VVLQHLWLRAQMDVDTFVLNSLCEGFPEQPARP